MSLSKKSSKIKGSKKNKKLKIRMEQLARIWKKKVKLVKV